MSFYSFYTTIHSRPGDIHSNGTRSLRELDVTTLGVPSGELGLGFDRTFEEVGHALNRFNRLYFEPDGSFVWASSADEAKWQLDGVLFDREGRVLYLDLKGSCPPETFDRLLTVLGWPSTRVMFQLQREAVFLDEAEFRRYAAAKE